jgi:hypothetical protein
MAQRGGACDIDGQTERSKWVGAHESKPGGERVSMKRVGGAIRQLPDREGSGGRGNQNRVAYAVAPPLIRAAPRIACNHCLRMSRAGCSGGRRGDREVVVAGGSTFIFCCDGRACAPWPASCHSIINSQPCRGFLCRLSSLRKR